MAKGKSTNPGVVPRALVIGVSEYPAPLTKLPAVAADVREMAKLLGSKHGAFRQAGVTVLTEKRAIRQQVLDSLETTLAGASPNEAIFVYLAGHGAIEGSDYFFVAHDTSQTELSKTGVPLAKIKTLFDRSPSRQVLLWLDCCHSGGILARGSGGDELSQLRRVLEVVKGEGKVIVAACTSSQSAYESPTLGHGFFTHALLRGLKGEAKSAQGEVTALSLYEFVHHQVTNPNQQPVFFGEMTGPIVLMYYPDSSSGNDKRPAKSLRTNPTTDAKRDGTWIMLGDHYFIAEVVRHQSDGKIEVRIVADGGEQEAALAALRPGGYGGRTSLPFAVNNDAHVVRVDHVHTETAAGKQLWTLSLSAEALSGTGSMEMTVNGVGPDEIARLRAGRILLNDPPFSAAARRGVGADSLLDSSIEASGSSYPVRECAIQQVFKEHGQLPDWKEFARLKAVFYLKISRTFEHVLEFELGPVQKDRVAVKCRGRRPQRFSNVAAVTIEVAGSCPLS